MKAEKMVHHLAFEDRRDSAKQNSRQDAARGWYEGVLGFMSEAMESH